MRSLTLDTVRGMLKSLPPWSRKPQGAGPLSVTQYIFMAWRENKQKRDYGFIPSCSNNITSDSKLLTRLKPNIPEPHTWTVSGMLLMSDCAWIEPNNQDISNNYIVQYNISKFTRIHRVHSRKAMYTNTLHKKVLWEHKLVMASMWKPSFRTFQKLIS